MRLTTLDTPYNQLIPLIHLEYRPHQCKEILTILVDDRRIARNDGHLRLIRTAAHTFLAAVLALHQYPIPIHLIQLLIIHQQVIRANISTRRCRSPILEVTITVVNLYRTRTRRLWIEW